MLCDARLGNASGPFNHTRHPQPTLVHAALVTAQTTSGVRLKPRQATVVAGEPDQRVVCHAELAQAFPQGADAAVHGHQFTIVILRLGCELGKRSLILGRRNPRTMRRAVPNHREERLLGLHLFANELQRLIDHYLGGVAAIIFKLAHAAQEWVALKKVCHRQPHIKADLAGAVGIIFQDRYARSAQAVKVPFPEMAGGVSSALHGASERLFLTAQGEAVIEHARAIVRSAGQHRCPCGRANWPTSIKAIKPQPRLGHGIKVRRLEQGMIVVPGLSPALIIGHHEDHVGAIGKRHDTAQQQ